MANPMLVPVMSREYNPPMSFWRWLTQTDAGLIARIGVGLMIFAWLGAIDLTRHGNRATRWREYAFLLFSVMVALAFGIMNDEVTVRLSPEYFLYGKGLAPQVEGHPERLAWEAAKVGLKATWTVGLLAGVILLMANNPSSTLGRVSYRSLAARMPMILGCAVTCAAGFGFAGYLGAWTGFSEDFREMVRREEFRPFRFMAVYGMHLGGYAGGAIGVVVAVFSIRRERMILRLVTPAIESN